MEKIKIGVFSLTCCEGCSLSILECEDEMSDLLNLIELNNFREASSYKGDEYKIAFIDGSCTTEEEVSFLKHIRRKAELVVAIGACSVMGGINAMKNFHKISKVKEIVYKDKSEWYNTFKTKPIDNIIEVDFYLHGCPINKNEFLNLVKSLVLGKKFKDKDDPVCAECKQKGNICVFEFGLPCLGPITKCGCEAICTSRKNSCIGCRGLVSEPNIEGLKKAFREYNINEDLVYDKLKLFNWKFLSDNKLI